jgi:hypothetical protein
VPDLLPEPQPVIKLTTATATKAERKNDMPETGSERRTGGSALIATS